MLLLSCITLCTHLLVAIDVLLCRVHRLRRAKTGKPDRESVWCLVSADFHTKSTVDRDPDDMAESSSTAAPPSIPVVFSTKTPYQLPPQKFMIPASWRRFQLSQLINTSLALPRVVPFDFLIRGVLLKGSLSELANGEVSMVL
jgi:hypothetical protein